MTRKTYVTILGTVLALGLLVIAPHARADEADQATQLTFNQAVDMPNHVVLPAGTYWFVVDPNIPNLVRVFDADRMHVRATVLTNSAIRPDATDHTQLTFAEQSRKTPVALLSWFYPDRMTGREFVYSARQESQLAERNKLTVMATPEG